MPELPDLEVFSQHIAKKLRGKKVTGVDAPGKGLNSNVSIQRIKKKIVGALLTRVDRDGKELFFHFNNGHVLGFHLMLHGRFYWKDEEGEKRHTILTLSFSNNKHLSVTDFQYRAKVTFDPAENNVPDALDPGLGFSFWKEKLRSKARIKNLLLDQKVVRGIGNAYADEILWAARISPFSIASKIPDTAVRTLAKAIPRVLKKAINQIKKASEAIVGGEIRDFLDIHNAETKKSPTGAIIKHEKKGRITYYTEEQQLFA